MSDLVHLNDNQLWTLACRFGKQMFEFAESDLFDDDPYLRERIQQGCMQLTTHIAEAHQRDATHAGRVILAGGLAHLRELAHYLSLAERLHIEDYPGLPGIRDTYERLWNAFALSLESMQARSA